MLFINMNFKFETGTSDVHQLIITIFKVKPDKSPPRIIKYRDYKDFERKAVNSKVQVSLKTLILIMLASLNLKQYLWNF